MNLYTFLLLPKVSCVLFFFLLSLSLPFPMLHCLSPFSLPLFFRLHYDYMVWEEEKESRERERKEDWQSRAMHVHVHYSIVLCSCRVDINLIQNSSLFFLNFLLLFSSSSTRRRRRSIFFSFFLPVFPTAITHTHTNRHRERKWVKKETIFKSKTDYKAAIPNFSHGSLFFSCLFSKKERGKEKKDYYNYFAFTHHSLALQTGAYIYIYKASGHIATV